MNKKEIIIVVLALLAALALRVYFVPAPGYMRDIQLFKIWGQKAVEHGVHNVYDKTWCDYPPGYLYVLKAVGAVYRSFVPDFKEQTYLFNFLVKFPPLLADILASLVIFLFLKKRYPFKVGFMAMLAYAFNPVIVFDSAWWGQADAVPLLLALLAVLALTGQRFGWAWAILTAAILVKTQMFILLPLFALVTWKKKGFSSLIKSLAYAWAAFLAVVAPFLLNGRVDRIMDRILDSVGAYPHFSMNAFNLWWLLSWGKGRVFVDSDLFLGLISYRTIGTLLLGAFIVLVLRYVYSRTDDDRQVFLACALCFFAFFMLPTEMHERYIFPVFAFLLLAAIKDFRLKIAYAVLSITAFLNLYLSVLATYPQNFPVSADFWQAFPFGLVVSFVNVAVLAAAVLFLTGDKKVRRTAALLLAAFVFLGAAKFVFSPSTVYVSDLEPGKKYQEWGKLQKDRTVDGARLRVNGYHFAKGLGTHARSRLTYDLGGRYRVLEGFVGLDDEQSKGNKVSFFVQADGRTIYRSGPVHGGQNPRHFRIDVSGVKKLKLLVEDGGDGINCDHADWLNLELKKPLQ